ncbi:lysophospholipid acyltransferase family protein [Nioella aestuarii]
MTLDAFYRRIEVVGADRFPTDQPVIVLANHSNSLVDGAVLTAFLPRMPRFLGASTVWDYRPLRPFLNAAGVVPLFRRQDGRAHMGSLADSFSSASDLLEAGGVLAIFPEGISHNNPRILPLKTGAARIALETETRRGTSGLVIVPVCLTFEAKHRVRSRALLEIGDPAQMTTEEIAAFRSDSRQDRVTAVRALTSRLHDRLDAMTPGHESWEEARLVARAAEMIGNTEPDPARAEALFDIAERRRGIHDGYLWVQKMQPARTEALRRQISDYDRALRRSGLRDDQIAHGVASAGGPARKGRKRTIAKTALLAPVALVGLALNLLPFWVLRSLSRRKDLDKRSTWSIFAGIFVYPMFWVLTGLIAGVLSASIWGAAVGWTCGIAIILIALGTGRPTLTFLDNIAVFLGEARARVLLGGRSQTAKQLTTQRARIQAELSTLSQEYAAYREQLNT